MKAKFVIAGILTTNLIVFWCLAHHYEFHTGMDGRVIWRCNNFTGKVEHSSFGEDKWVVVSSPTPFVPPRPDEIETSTKTNSSWIPPEVLAEEKKQVGSTTNVAKTNLTAEQFLDAK